MVTTLTLCAGGADELMRGKGTRTVASWALGVRGVNPPAAAADIDGQGARRAHAICAGVQYLE